ncbi:MAG: ATP phosphoribosyltransferase [Spirochaetes bacterium]|nr:ATP phosphoribosyltransferase [Spirochaetota bacterium]
MRFANDPANKLRMLIPQGKLMNNVARLLSEAGFPFSITSGTKQLVFNSDWLEAKIMKPQNIGDFLDEGKYDVGFTGLDWILERGANVEEIINLDFDASRVVAAAAPDLDDVKLRSKKLVVAAKYVNLAEAWLKSSNYEYRVIRAFGNTGIYSADDADMIVDSTLSGKLLKDNRLRAVGTLLESSTRFVACRDALTNAKKRARIEELAMLFRAVLDAREKVMIEMNVPKDCFDPLVKTLPAMRSPTVAPLYGDDGFAVKIAIKKSEVPALIPRLKEMGALDILEYELRKVVP